SDLYRRYAGAVTTVARSGLWSDDLVADAVQQTFVKAWRARADFDPNRPFAPWLYAIARRTVIDLVRRERRRQHPEPPNEAIVTLPTELSDVWEKFQVRVALDELPDEERQVLRQIYFEGRTQVETAGVLGIPLGTVKSRSHRAHQRLSELLGHLVEEPFADPDRMEGQG
ncbi:MAG: RNA polymerase sigma factor, partial [Acidimicrobiia bacterium]|nr:RNA polymerase sigma factor [Acidimicrobiia bacterium]